MLYTAKGQPLTVDGTSELGLITFGMWCEYPRNLTWKKPKTKREGWAVLQKATMCYDEKTAKNIAEMDSSMIAVFGTWEE